MKNNLIKLTYLPSILRIGLIGTLVFELDRVIKYNSGGYFYIYPMPQENNLAKYYQTQYWSSYRKEKMQLLRNRDLYHLQLILNLCELNISEINFLNFGAGHGGLSHLIFTLQGNVVNIDHDRFLFGLHVGKTNWSCFNDMSKIKKTHFDIIYSSHSLEHVVDIEATIKTIYKLLKPGGYFFVEVPNCEDKNTLNGGVDYQIHVPHTYYFKREFFEKLPLESIHCEIYNDNNEICDFNKLGSSIRYLGRKSN